MASKRAAVFATKFEDNQPRKGKSLHTRDYSEMYMPVFSDQGHGREELPEYSKQGTGGDIQYLSAFNLGVNNQ